MIMPYESVVAPLPMQVCGGKRKKRTMTPASMNKKKRKVTFETAIVDVCDEQQGLSDSETSTTIHVPLHNNTESITPDASTPMTEEQRRTLWYQKDEISGFMRQVGTLLRARKQRAATPLLQTTTALNDADEFCGLERHNEDRAKAKRMAIKLVVKSQKVDRSNADFVKRVSETCSQHARRTACLQGHTDFYNAYASAVNKLQASVTALSTKKSPFTEDLMLSRPQKRLRHC